MCSVIHHITSWKKINSVVYIVLLMVVFCTNSTAASYQTEAGFFRGETNIDPDNNITLTGIGGVYYFESIDVDGPLAESSFIAKASSINITFSKAEFGFGAQTLDGNGYGLSLRYLLPDSDFLLGGSYLNQNVSGSGLAVDISSVEFNIGAYIEDKTLVTVSYETRTFSIIGFPDTEVREIGVAVKKLIDNISMELDIIRDNSDDGSVKEVNTSLGVSGDYYIDNTLSVGVGFENNSGDDVSSIGNTFSVGMTKFMNETVAFDLDYERFSASFGNDSNRFYFAMMARF